MSKLFLQTTEGSEITIERAKEAAAICAVDNWINEHTKVIGIGTGSIMVYVVKRLGERFWSEPKLCNLVCIATSIEAQQLILAQHLQLETLEHYPNIDVTIDGANEIDKDMTMINGFAGCMVQQKTAAFNAKKLIIVCDYTKISTRLGERWCLGIPIEVLPRVWQSVRKEIVRRFDGDPVVRTAKMKVGPIRSDNGNIILDWHFIRSRDYNWKKVNDELLMIPGVAETGLFIDIIAKIYYGLPDGNVRAVNAITRDKCEELES